MVQYVADAVEILTLFHLIAAFYLPIFTFTVSMQSLLLLLSFWETSQKQA